MYPLHTIEFHDRDSTLLRPGPEPAPAVPGQGAADVCDPGADEVPPPLRGRHHHHPPTPQGGQGSEHIIVDYTFFFS